MSAHIPTIISHGVAVRRGNESASDFTERVQGILGLLPEGGGAEGRSVSVLVEDLGDGRHKATLIAEYDG